MSFPTCNARAAQAIPDAGSRDRVFMRRSAGAVQLAPRGTSWEARRRYVSASLALVLAASVAACGAQTAAPARDGAGATGAGNDGALTLLDGRSTTLAAYRGSPVLVWFVAAGCASCAASIPAVAQHLPSFARAHTNVLVLGVFGAFGRGAQGRTQLASFGQEAAGARFSDAGWTWGLASAALTAAYDPGGVPDEYFLLDAGGRVAYEGSVPVSTMGALLAHLESVAA